MNEPIAAHKWEEQFKVKGERLGRPTEEKLKERIAELRLAINLDDASIDRAEAKKKEWKREIAWRAQQLTLLQGS